MKRLSSFLCFFYVSFLVLAQQESRITQNMFAYNSVNPGSAGSSEMGEATLLYRSQNTGFKSSEGESLSPNLNLANFSMPVKKINSGIGVTVSQFNNGLEQTLKFKLNYSYQFKLSEGKLGLGVYLGGCNVGFEYDKLKANNPNEPILEKLKKNESYTNFDAGLGVHYKLERSYFGLSTTSINQSKLKVEGSTELNYIARHYYLYGGYEYQTSNPMLKLKPSVFVRSAGFAANLGSLSVLAEYNNFAFGGIQYSTNNDISGIFGVEFKNGSKFDGMKASISYDFITNQLRKYSNGTIEICIGYSFLMNVEKATKSYKSVRFL